MEVKLLQKMHMGKYSFNNVLGKYALSHVRGKKMTTMIILNPDIVKQYCDFF